jgi:nucleoside-diphosphate-sugar epimerase
MPNRAVNPSIDPAMNPAVARLAAQVAKRPTCERPEGVLILGGGFSGLRLGRALASQGIPVVLTHRTARTDRDGRPIAIAERPQELDGLLRWQPFESCPQDLPELSSGTRFSHLLCTIPPGRDGKDPALELLGPQLEQLPLRWVGYLSTTGVYGDHQGGWVDEGTPTAAGLGRSQARLACEQDWAARNWPLQRFRLPGIYGPGRCPFSALREGRSRLIHKPGQAFSRVHVDDIAGAVLHNLLLAAEQRPPVLNVADDQPCPSSETLGFAAHLLGLKLPPFERFEDVAETLSPMARSFWQDNRRVSNRLLCQGLGYTLIHPSYREGFRASLAEELSAPGDPADQGSAGRAIGWLPSQGGTGQIVDQLTPADHHPTPLETSHRSEHHKAQQQQTHHG